MRTGRSWSCSRATELRGQTTANNLVPTNPWEQAGADRVLATELRGQTTANNLLPTNPWEQAGADRVLATELRGQKSVGCGYRWNLTSKLTSSNFLPGSKILFCLPRPYIRRKLDFETRMTLFTTSTYKSKFYIFTHKLRTNGWWSRCLSWYNGRNGWSRSNIRNTVRLKRRQESVPGHTFVHRSCDVT